MKTICNNVRVLTAPNPGPMTFSGTNTYIIGSKSDLCILDPGPNIEQHYEALKELLKKEKGSHILVSHSHMDHSSMAKRLSKEFAIPIYAHGNILKSRSEYIKKILQSSKELGGLEGIDQNFSPDIYLSGGEKLTGRDWNLEVIYTPGHLSDHLSFSLEKEGVLFSGDIVMGWTSTLISPPDGDVGQYYLSLEKLLKRSEDLYFPGHGDKIENARKYVNNLKKHRLKREIQILELLREKKASSIELAKFLYKGLSDLVVIAGTRNVLAHLINLRERNLVSCDQAISPNTIFTIIDNT